MVGRCPSSDFMVGRYRKPGGSVKEGQGKLIQLIPEHKATYIGIEK